MSEDKRKTTLKKIPEEELAQVSGGIYEAKYTIPEGNTDINPQGGGVPGPDNGGKTNWGKEDQVVLQFVDGVWKPQTIEK